MRLYLSRLLLNPRSRQVQSELAHPYQMHRTISRAFSTVKFTENQPSGVLFRLDREPRSGLLTLLVQSQQPPDWTYLLQGRDYLLPEDLLPPHISANPAVKAVNLSLRAGQVLFFRLRANPTIKKVRRNADGSRRKNSNRVPLVREEKQIEWLKRKGEQHGFRLRQVMVSDPQKHLLWKHKPSPRTGNVPPITLFTVRFDGVLQITDPEAFAQALRQGIGPAKAFGCGLLSLAPA